MELPNYRLPSPRSVLLLMWEKARDFFAAGVYRDFPGDGDHLVFADL